eukprot:scaffold89366_cov60-Phaeocystis_antarctica.AAC.1
MSSPLRSDGGSLFVFYSCSSSSSSPGRRSADPEMCKEGAGLLGGGPRSADPEMCKEGAGLVLGGGPRPQIGRSRVRRRRGRRRGGKRAPHEAKKKARRRRKAVWGLPTLAIPRRSARR